MKKNTLIVAGIVAAAIILMVVMVAGINNRAISLEEQISGAEAQISVAEKRRVDLVYNLVARLQPGRYGDGLPGV